MAFDADKYKVTTRQQWEDTSDAWNAWGPVLEKWLGGATGRMLDAVGASEGSRVLDVAAGAGGQTIAAARRVGPRGRVVATDISPTILTYAARAAAEAGLKNVETVEADGEELGDFAGAGFDAVISRVGLIYFPDQNKALSGMRNALREGGRIGAIVYSTPEKNEFFSIPVAIIRNRAQLPPPQPGQPGPFSLGAPAVLERVFTDAGFRDISVETVPAPLRLSSAAECVRFERESFGALHQMLGGVPADERAQVWSEIEEALLQFDTGDGFEAPCELLVASGIR
ncbi:MAG TPA: methyltransferase domain-containing protein [Actinomycetota bacterium]|nr:methyltransferase domain-containing protein [Actinomycetota bacterium]